MRSLIAVVAISGAPMAAAQSTGGVFGPVVDASDEAWDFRVSYDPDSENTALRLHYQRAINSDLRWRVIGQVRSTETSDFDPDHLTAQLLWQVTPDLQAYQSGLRFDGRYRFDDRPGQFTIHWVHQWRQVDHWTLRFISGATLEIGDGAQDGLAIQTRTSAMRSLNSGPKLGAELFSQYGSTTDWLDFEDQRHQAGPVAVWSLGEGWGLYTGALLGVSEAAPDATFRVRATYTY
ncbi:MAG: hypothetical protein AAFQ85_08120 [Pseudomonadota bacterium]